MSIHSVAYLPPCEKGISGTDRQAADQGSHLRMVPLVHFARLPTAERHYYFRGDLFSLFRLAPFVLMNEYVSVHTYARVQALGLCWDEFGFQGTAHVRIGTSTVIKIRP